MTGNLLFDTIFRPYCEIFRPKMNEIKSRDIRFIPFEKQFIETSTELSKHLPIYKSADNPSIPYLASCVNRNDVIHIPTSPEGIIIGVWVITGPESGIINIWSNDTKEQENICIYDIYSHYDRFTIRR